MAPCVLLAIKFDPGSRLTARDVEIVSSLLHNPIMVDVIRGPLPRIEALLIHEEVEPWTSAASLGSLRSGIEETLLDYVSLYIPGQSSLVLGRASAIYSYEKCRRVGETLQREWFNFERGNKLATLLAMAQEFLPNGEEIMLLRNTVEFRAFLEAEDRELSGEKQESVREVLRSVGISWRRWRSAGAGIAARLGFERTYF